MDPRIECLRSISDLVGQGMIVAGKGGEILVENEVARFLSLSDSGKERNGKPPKQRGLRKLLKDWGCATEKPQEKLIPLFELKSGRHKNYRVRLGSLDCGDGEEMTVLFAMAEPERVHFGEIDTLMLSRIRHEIRTPLTTLRGFAELMLHRVYPESKRKQFLRIIVEETDRLVDFVDEIFSLEAVGDRSKLEGERSQETK